MSVRLHKVTIFIADDGISTSLDKLTGDIYHTPLARIMDVKTVEFDRTWTEDDPLNQTTTWNDIDVLNNLVEAE